jgi:hypothetical protein
VCLDIAVQLGLGWLGARSQERFDVLLVEDEISDYDEVYQDRDVHDRAVDADAPQYDEFHSHEIGDYRESHEPPREQDFECLLVKPFATEGDEEYQGKVDDELGDGQDVKVEAIDRIV